MRMPAHRTFALSMSIATIAAAFALPTLTHAAPATVITWGAPHAIIGDSDVLATGTIIGAFNLGVTGVTGTTVNGVTFAPFALTIGGSGTTTSGNFSLAITSANGTNTGAGSASAPFSSLNAPYQTLLQSAGTSFNAGGGMALTMTGLTVGQAYTFQWWSNDSSTTFLPFDSAVATGPSGTTVTLNDNPTATTGALGQYDIGTFTAAAATVVVNYSNVTNPEILNGFVLATVPAPEPASCVLVLGGMGMLLGARRRRVA